ncbi:hypothetical protein GPJ56_009719 [Histomonas meleagridis]|uniref:uncharacterized protein n=1 Tax=Histomonas meleagridis TaxID=135588 RepID=UPI0035595FBA|nr:hypothetical protein GPJ56_009719 [Histomonas meleagridis]KAH0802281.1 hypothetical protein GO595_004894 [Histomonas meleagridis]
MICDNLEDYEIMQKEIERLKGEMQSYLSKIPSIPRNLTEPEIGGLLLKAFLDDKPYDNYLFSLLPIKKAFLEAAYQTKDQEIIYEALNLIKRSLTDPVFDELIHSNSKYQKSWEKYSQTKSNLVNLTDEDSKRIEVLQMHLPSSNGLMKIVLNDAITRLEGKNQNDKFCGLEPADQKWLELMQCTKDTEKLPRVRNIVWTKQILSRDPNLSGVPPIQGALYAKSRGLPPHFVNEIGKYVEENEAKQLIDHDIKL